MMTTWEEVSKQRDAWEDRCREVVKDYVQLLQILADELDTVTYVRILDRIDNDRKRL